MYLDAAKKQEIFGKYGKSNTDTGSAEAQIALFSYRIARYHSSSEKAGIAMAYRQNLLYTCKDHKQTFRHRMLHQVKEYLIFAIYSY